ncbi:ribosome maturation factor RimP [Desulfovirgula thermocuniculi]|uniref:ribosome maturation factor RimP n=1 Tax=Desulfovirgula thermocuniculi TaxID=348842 RepID=UPI0004187CB5|nr:ribosome maturation factor RimP [Desulfovirgula thermocuniculi]
MAKSKVVAVVEELARPVVASLGMELVDVEYVKEGGRWYLRVFIDKPGGVTLDDCQAVSERLDPLLDETDPIPHSYHLEVSSPGVERPLKKPSDYERFAGRRVQLTTFTSLDGQKRFTGHLVGLVDQEVVLVTDDGRERRIPLAQVAQARLKATWS